MSMILHRALALRLEIGLLVLPIALAWGRGAGGLSGRGVLAAVGVTLLAIFLFSSLDAAFFSAGRARRYSPSTRTLEFSLHGAQLVRLISGIALALAGLVLLVVEWRLGSYLLISLAVFAVLYRRRPRGASRPPFPPLAAVIFTVVVLVVPPVLAAASPWAAPARAVEGSPGAGPGLIPAAAPEAAGAAAVAMTGLGALLLLLFLLLCSVRDETADTSDGIRSIAARRGRASAVAAAAVLGVGLLSLVSIGAARQWWPWEIAAGASVLVVVASWLLSARADNGAAKVWSAGQLVLAWSLFIGQAA